jgi:hypothetical protein
MTISEELESINKNPGETLEIADPLAELPFENAPMLQPSLLLDSTVDTPSQPIADIEELPQEIDLTRPVPACMELGKKFIGISKGYRIFLVNGEYIRNNLETSFTMASHHWMSRFIPQDEVWIDDKMSDLDKVAVIHHEIYELLLMQKGLPYEKAHARATRSEKWLRKKNISP